MGEAEDLKKTFSNTVDKLIKDIKRQEKIMIRSDKRQRQEYDELQHRLEEVQKLQLAQKELMDSFIKLMAGAIDAKSKYTGNHCSRVPEITMMIAQKASEYDVGIFKEFKIKSDEEYRELEIASWLHDCGKVITPEYVVDKATKLETIYNRIHEIRTRFEVIHRDLTIEALNKKLAGSDAKEVDSWLEKEHNKLLEEFEFVAKSNVGSEFMSDDDQDRISIIAKKTWTRNFDDTLGLAHEEKKRVLKEQSVTPSIETLLSDKARHIIPREHRDLEEYKEKGFKTPIPDDLYNLGEIYNLNITRGTLTQEERFKIMEHAMMTIKMLETLPFTDTLKNVPLYAGAHHETLIGTGYPRKLTIDDMPIPARIMALADVFEALTAHDRPYKEPKTLSESIKILSFMVKDQHLDKDIFELFLKTGIYKEYAANYLQEDQLDEVDINKFLS
ncbi:MAG: HD domain-containing phosphohydrolase [Campylobacterota bacterium]|nr:HD domain-containing phosphohydrolase [Campylobacterota bacterium]